MITREDVLADAIQKCMKELYSLAQPSVTYEDFVEENKQYNKKREEYYSTLEKPSLYEESAGPKPYEFYYLPKDVIKDVVDSYVYAYKLNEQQELLNIIEILKEYCQAPIVEKYIKGKDGSYRGYEHPDNLEKEIFKIIDNNIPLYQPPKKLVSGLQDKFFEFLDMAGKFYNWTSELNAFNTSIYLGASPSSNKEAVIENWKKYRNKDIVIDEILIRQNCYGDE